ncbi:MAG: tetratricopeptide repeat protein [Bryobacterales bacterium]|nr:tetratricopeptide repeat protein [Bryobacterales bacterium]
MRFRLPLFLLAPALLPAQLLDPPKTQHVGSTQRQVVESRVDRLNTAQRIALWEGRLKEEPANPQHAIRLAEAYIQKMRETTDYGYLDRAEKLLARVLGKDAENYEALIVRNQVNLFRHDFHAVVATGRKLAERKPKDPANWAMLGDALMEMGQYDPAADAYQQMVNLRPDLMSYNRIAWYRFITGDMDGAIQMMTRAVRAGRPGHENTAWCFVELGNLYLKSAKWAQAEWAYRNALENFAGMHSAHAGLGHVFAAQGKTEAAIESFRKAQSMAPMIDYAGALADLYTLQGKPEEAHKQIQTLDLVAKMEAASGQKANRQLALIFANHGHKTGEAVEIAKADLAVRKDVYTWDAYAWALFRAGDVAGAKKASENALKAGTPEPLFYYHAGMIAKTLGEGDRARTLLRKALDLNPKFDVRHAAEAAQLVAGDGATSGTN